TELLLELLPDACDRWDVAPSLPPKLAALLRTHLDAAVVVPAMLWLLEGGLLTEDGPRLTDTAAAQGIRRLLTALGWLDPSTASWTPIGREASALAVHFGMAASYLPLLARLPDLYRGRRAVPPAVGEPEWHVHRQLNV